MQAMAGQDRGHNSLPDALRRQLAAMRTALLGVHQALLDHERMHYERVHGRVEGSVELLGLVINDPAFAWLRQLSELVVQIDELLSAKDPPPTVAGAQTLFAQARQMVQPHEQGANFQRRYYRALQDDPAVGR